MAAPSDDIPDVAATDLVDPTFCGFLNKKRPSKKLLSVKYQKRWCIIHSSVFYYYDGQLDRKQKGAFHLQGYKFFHLAGVDHSFAFVKKGNRSFEFIAPNKREFEKWREALNTSTKEKTGNAVNQNEDNTQETPRRPAPVVPKSREIPKIPEESEIPRQKKSSVPRYRAPPVPGEIEKESSEDEEFHIYLDADTIKSELGYKLPPRPVIATSESSEDEDAHIYLDADTIKSELGINRPPFPATISKEKAKRPPRPKPKKTQPEPDQTLGEDPQEFYLDASEISSIPTKKISSTKSQPNPSILHILASNKGSRQAESNDIPDYTEFIADTEKDETPEADDIYLDFDAKDDAPDDGSDSDIYLDYIESESSTTDTDRSKDRHISRGSSMDSQGTTGDNTKSEIVTESHDLDELGWKESSEIEKPSKNVSNQKQKEIVNNMQNMSLQSALMDEMLKKKGNKNAMQKQKVPKPLRKEKVLNYDDEPTYANYDDKEVETIRKTQQPEVRHNDIILPVRTNTLDSDSSEDEVYECVS